MADRPLSEMSKSSRDVLAATLIFVILLLLHLSVLRAVLFAMFSDGSKLPEQSRDSRARFFVRSMDWRQQQRASSLVSPVRSERSTDVTAVLPEMSTEVKSPSKTSEVSSGVSLNVKPVNGVFRMLKSKAVA